ncbi:MAG: sporulation protein YhbH [Patescibacteria group bacterium]|nr:sporulation protein YhbH [Patescibacteria group bacterium]
MAAQFSISKDDYSLHRKGPADQARHKEKVKEAIRDNLPGIVSQESIITSDGKKIVKVPIRSLNLPYFRFGNNQGRGVGQGQGDSNVGDKIGNVPAPGGNGKEAGDTPGIDYYEAELTIDEIAEMVFADLSLPGLKPKQAQEIVSEVVRYKDISKKGIMSNLDKRRTLLQGFKRTALQGRGALSVIKQEDLRFRTWSEEVRPESNAVVIAMRDISGSMGEFEKYISRSFYYWMVKFLRTKYNQVQIVFITHHTEAKEVDENAFFNLGESGGTKVSSAYKLALEIVHDRFPPACWNIYPFHFSDGDNWGEDNSRALGYVQELLAFSNLFGYGEIQESRLTDSTASAFISGSSKLGSVYQDHFRREIEEGTFVPVAIGRGEDVYPALRRYFFRKEGAING